MDGFKKFIDNWRRDQQQYKLGPVDDTTKSVKKEKTRTNKGWTGSKLKELNNHLIDTETTIPKIAQKMGVSYNHVRVAIRYHKDKLPNIRARAEQKSFDNTKEKKQRGNYSWTQDKVDRLNRATKNGLKGKELHDYVGATGNAVKNYLTRQKTKNGIPLPGRNIKFNSKHDEHILKYIKMGLSLKEVATKLNYKFGTRFNVASISSRIRYKKLYHKI